MKQKLVALLLVSVMVASAFGAMGLSATKVDAAGTALTLSSTNYSPKVGQQYTLSGYLRDANGKGIANKPIDIYYHFTWSELTPHVWRYSNTVYTGPDGKYSTTTSSSQTVTIQTGYKVGGVYLASSNVVTINVPKIWTGQLLVVSPSIVIIGQKYTLTGYLHDANGKGIANKPIYVYYAWAGVVSRWYYSNIISTDQNGYYSTTTSSSRSIYIKMLFPGGDSVYESSISNSVGITVQKIPTTLTLDSPAPNPYPWFANTPYIISGYLKDSAGNPLAGQPIKIWYRYPSETGVWHYSNTIYTLSDGGYGTFASSPQDIYLHTNFPGDGTHAESNTNEVLVDV
jgi:hypothetical protein